MRRDSQRPKTQKQIDEQLEEKALERSVAQRLQWKEQLGITNRQLFELFSEFTALMMISREKKIEDAPDSIKSKFKRYNEASNDYLAELFPYPPKCLRTIGEERRTEKLKKQQLSAEELQDFRVPASIFMNASQLMIPIRQNLRPKILKAIGIDVK